ncbi:Fanconi anemia core complex-associated protein 20 isoform X1 [Dipodomys spectabilis]|uniref:Fanconi anemia core complex-associated protein 20 isoform X1 n=2 Tax=Dipodomys spectabilis TaxID=105255 RepID=UPI001C53BBE3|nr:Fanconi anemia core complex-associated protein 20 isoform X1 [Dipodomys spectabilis]
MAAARPPGRLSRRRPPRDGFPPRSASGAAASEPWAALLRAAGVGRSPDLEPLPALPGQDPEPGPDGPAPPEVFTVGSQVFSWTPLPPPPAPAPAPAPTSPTGPRKGRPAPAPRGAPGAPPSCPACRTAFAPQLDQLDVDSHLAQCLAEGMEDVAW